MRAPHRVAHYLEDLASAYHKWYNLERVVPMALTDPEAGWRWPLQPGELFGAGAHPTDAGHPLHAVAVARQQHRQRHGYQPHPGVRPRAASANESAYRKPVA